MNVLTFGIFMCWTLISTLAALLAPDPRVGFSIFSVLELIGLYAPLILRPTAEFDANLVKRIFIFYVRLCATLGIFQFAIQFAHIRLFSIGHYLPQITPWLLEPEFAVESVIKYGSTIMRSNGFFLLEPSIFSQLLALGLYIDIFVFGKKLFIPIYAIGFMTSYSGTGLLTLLVTFAVVGITSVQNATRVGIVAVVGVAALSVFSAVFPDQVASFLGRTGELQSTNTSAYARYMAPLAELHSFSGETRLLLGYGPGATARAKTYTAGSGSAALQLAIDYGIVGAVSFFAFLICVLGSRSLSLTIVLLFNFQFGGGYLLVPPIVFMMLILGVWGSGKTEAKAKAPLASRNSERVRNATGVYSRDLRLPTYRG